MEEGKQQELETIPEENSNFLQNVPITEEILTTNLQQLKKQAKISITPELENQFCDLLTAAIKFYDDEMKYELAPFYYEYGSILLQKLESTTDIFGDLIKKKAEAENPEETQQQPQQEQQQQIKKPVQQQEQKQEQVQVQQESQTTIYKDNEVQIQDEPEQNQEQQQQQKQQEEIKTQEESQNKQNQQQQAGGEETNHDDMQILYENLYTAFRIAEKDVEKLKRNNTPEEIKADEFSRSRIQFFADACFKLGEFENWREKFDDSLEYFTKAKEFLIIVDDPQTSRIIAELEFMIGTTHLYKNEPEELTAIKHIISSIQILENNLSKLCSLPEKIFPSEPSQITKNHIEVEHLKENFLDTLESKDLKSILKSVYNKLEDTILQRDQKPEFEAEQQRMKQQKDQNTFKPVDTTKVQVKNLGVIGNAKKRKPVQYDQPLFQNQNQQNKDNSDKQLPQQEQKQQTQENNQQQQQQQEQNKPAQE